MGGGGVQMAGLSTETLARWSIWGIKQQQRFQSPKTSSAASSHTWEGAHTTRHKKSTVSSDTEDIEIFSAPSCGEGPSDSSTKRLQRVLKITHIVVVEHLTSHFGTTTVSGIPASPGVDLALRAKGESGGKDVFEGCCCIDMYFELARAVAITPPHANGRHIHK